MAKKYLSFFSIWSRQQGYLFKFRRNCHHLFFRSDLENYSSKDFFKNIQQREKQDTFSTNDK